MLETTKRFEENMLARYQVCQVFSAGICGFRFGIFVTIGFLTSPILKLLSLLFLRK